MKRKVLGIVLATVLLLSMGLVTAVPVGANPGELVTNGSFETPDVLASPGWAVYANGTVGLGWNVEWRDRDPSPLGGYWRPFPAQLEIHDATGIGWGAAADGNQWAELDTDWYEPPYGVVDDTTVEPSSVKIYQDLDTVAGEVYLLSFAFSARQDTVPIIVNRLGVYWDGTQIYDIDRTGQSFGWIYYNGTFVAPDSSTRLEFRDLGVSDGYGTLLDAVSVVPVSINITKEADREYAYEGDTINYLYRVHNDGDVPVGPPVVTDSLPITVTPVEPGGGPYNRGDLNHNEQLDPCETWYFRASYTVPDPCARRVIPNTATAVASTGLSPATRVRAESDAVEVRILHPCIELRKWTIEEPPAYFNGTEITYYYGVHNCGDTPLELHRVMDTTLGQDANSVLGIDGKNRGDLRNKGVWDPCETWYFSLDHTLVCPPRNTTYSDFCNYAVAAAFEPILDSRFFDDTMWKVRIFQWLPRTIGYWGNWDNHWEETTLHPDMSTLVRYVNFQSSYFGYPGDGEYYDLTLGDVHDLLLDPPKKGKMDATKAEDLLRKQLLAAWLSVKSYEGATDTNDDTPGSLNAAMDPDATVYINGVADGTVEELLHRIENALCSDTLGIQGMLLAKDILEAMNSAESNNYLMFMDPDF